MRIILLAYMIAFLLVMPLSAKNLYVNNSIGNDATTYANNSQSTPWASVGRAVWGSTDPNATNSGEAAAAGDTVFVSAGTYSTDVTCSRGETEGLYRTVNSGTSGNLIVFYAQGTVDLRQTNAAMAVLGMHDSYVEWNGFTINSANNSLRPNYEMTLVDFGGTGNRLLNCDLTMGYFPFAGNNTPCIYVHTSTDGYIANNTLDGSSGDGGENNSAMTFYNNNNLIFE